MIYAFLLNSLIVAVVILVHYEFLYRATVVIPKLRIEHRYRIVIAVFGAMTAHVLEIWIFAAAYYLMNGAENWGRLTGNFDGSFIDSGYYSFTVYTTLGFGDIVPLGNLRYLTGLESLTGLVLITWSASFLFFEMQKHWNAR